MFFFWWGGRFLSLEIGVSSPGILKIPFCLLGNIYVSIRREKREKGFLFKLTHIFLFEALSVPLCIISSIGL